MTNNKIKSDLNQLCITISNKFIIIVKPNKILGNENVSMDK